MIKYLTRLHKTETGFFPQMLEVEDVGETEEFITFGSSECIMGAVTVAHSVRKSDFAVFDSPIKAAQYLSVCFSVESEKLLAMLLKMNSDRAMVEHAIAQGVINTIAKFDRRAK